MKKLIIADHYLRDYRGHFFPYCMAVRKEALERGLEVQILAHREIDPGIAPLLQAVPCFPTVGEHPNDLKRKGLARRVRQIQSIFRSTVEFGRSLQERMTPSVNRATLVFVPMCCPHVFLPWLLWLAGQSPQRSPTLVLFLRLPCKTPGRPSWRDHRSLFYRAVFVLARVLETRHRLCFVTDSSRLQQEFVEITGHSVELLPIPHTFVEETDEPAPGGSDRVSFALLGDMREEKGFDIFVKALSLLSKRESFSRMYFRVQCAYNPMLPEMLKFRKSLHRMGLRNVMLIPRALDTTEYLELLRSSDVVILPYRQARYRSRTSGPFIESVVEGRVVVVTENTWMSEQLDLFGGGGLVFADQDEESLAKTMEAAAAGFPELQSRAWDARKKVAGYHNPKNFLDQLLLVTNSKKAKSRPLPRVPTGELGM